MAGDAGGVYGVPDVPRINVRLQAENPEARSGRGGAGAGCLQEGGGGGCGEDDEEVLSQISIDIISTCLRENITFQIKRCQFGELVSETPDSLIEVDTESYITLHV